VIAAVYRGVSQYGQGLKRHAFALVLTAVVASLAEVAVLLIVVRVALGLSSEAQTIELPLLGVDIDTGRALLIAAAGGVMTLLAHVALAWLTATILSSVLFRVRTVTIDRYIRAGWSTQALQREGALQETVTTLGTKTAGLAQSLCIGGSQVLSLVIFIGAAALVSPASTGVVVLLGSVLVVVLRPIILATRRNSRAYVAGDLQYAAKVARVTSMMMEIRSFGAQNVVRQELLDASDAARGAQRRSRFFGLFGGGLYKDLAILLLVAAVWSLSLASAENIGSIGVVVVLMLRALNSAQAVSTSYQAINEGGPNLEALTRGIDTLVAGAAHVGTQSVSSFKAIALRDVGYQYADAEPALSGISLTIGQGEAIGVVGPSGGGKSTLVQVLLRLRPPTQGVVLVGGLNYLEFDDADWAALVAYVPQEPTLLEASVADNIRFYRDIDRDLVLQAARDANVFDDIMRLPNGFDSVLGPRGTGLSGGQKQRVAIARALVAKPQLLVMDEPSSALDVHSEQLLQESIMRLKRSTTIVIVAHRMKTVKSCDRLVVLERGTISQIGPTQELLGQEGFLLARPERSSSGELRLE
jgi:ATP-binding cassette, subfamily B, bacterial